MFLERVQKICAQKGISIAQLESDIGVSRGSVYKWRKHSPSLDVACKVANYLGTSLDDLVGYDFNFSNEKSKHEAPDIDDNFYNNFDALLKERGIRAADVSKATGIAASTFTDWKKGRYVPKIDKLLLIADFLGVSIDCLIGKGKETDYISSPSAGVYERILQLCSASDISVTSLEFELGIGKGLIGKWRKNSPNIISLQKVADYFNVSVDYLLGRECPASSSFVFSPDEKSLILLFRELNDEGQGKARSYIDDLVASGRYIKSDQTGLLERDS